MLGFLQNTKRDSIMINTNSRRWCSQLVLF
jgi:hypothetical protein